MSKATGPRDGAGDAAAAARAAARAAVCVATLIVARAAGDDVSPSANNGYNSPNRSVPVYLQQQLRLGYYSAVTHRYTQGSLL